jgi:CRP/FNR family transcriptional regulator
VTAQVRIVPVKRRRKHEPPTSTTPHPLHSIASTLAGPFFKERLLGNLSRPVLDGFEGISSPASFPKGAILFVEGEEAHSVFALLTGRVKLTTSSADGKALLLRIAEPGEMIGLPGIISGKTYVLTAEALEPLQVTVVLRKPLMEFLRTHSEAALRVAEILNEIYHATFRELQRLALSGSAAEKLARFFLDAAVPIGPSNNQLGARVTLTHEEIAEMIGVARETVTRLVATFKRERLIQAKGSQLVIIDKAGLEKLVRA